MAYQEAEPFTTRIKQVDFSKIRRDLKHYPRIHIEEGIPIYIDPDYSHVIANPDY